MYRSKIAAALLAVVMTVTALTGCGVNKDAIIANVGNTHIRTGLANFMCRYYQARMDDMYAELLGSADWSQDLYGNGSTLEDEAKSSVMEQLHEMYTLADEGHMAQYGVSLTDEEMTYIRETASAFCAANSEEVLKEMGADPEIVEEMLRLRLIKNKMHAAIVADADTNISEEEANMRSYTMVSSGIQSYLDPQTYTYVDYTEEQIAEIISGMNTIYASVQNGVVLEDAAEAIGVEAQHDYYDADDQELEAEIKEVMDQLKEGETSSIIKTDEAIYIVRIDLDHDEEATARNRESILAGRQDLLYEEILSEWQESDGWHVSEKQLSTIRFRNHFTLKQKTAEQ